MLLQGLDAVPWADLEHAYGSAEDVPGLLRKLLYPDPEVRSATLWTLYGNVYHQGTRCQASAYVVPFLIELSASPEVPNRGDLLGYWGNLITGFFSVQERPLWGDGEQTYADGQVVAPDPEDAGYVETLHRIYRESVKGHGVVCNLLDDDDTSVRAGAAWVLACLPTLASASIPALQAQFRVEPSGWARAAMAFALGELGDTVTLRSCLERDPSPAVCCMAACELARIEPAEALIKALLRFVSEPIEEYENVLGAGGKSTGDAAFSLSHLPLEVQRRAIPAICDQLDQARSFDTMPLVSALLGAAFPTRDEAVTELDALQRQVLARMVNTGELWSIGNLWSTFEAYGLPKDREQCAELVGIQVVDDEAKSSLRSGLAFAQMGFLDKGREGILKALELDAAVLENAPQLDESWLLCAKAFAETDPERALAALRRAITINPVVAQRINPTWHLAKLLKEQGRWN